MYFLVKFIDFILHILPLKLSLFLGKLIGLFFYLNPKKRRVGIINLKQAFPYKDFSQLFPVLKKSYLLFGESIIETFIIDKLLDKVELKMREKPEEGDIIVGVHEGSWELYNVVLANQFKFAVLAERQKNNKLDKFLNEKRRSFNLKVCFSLKELIRSLKEGYRIGIVIDQGMEKNAKLIPFFNQLVPTAGGAPFLAKKFKKRIFVAFGYREGNSHRIVIEKPLECENMSEEEILLSLNKIFERYISLHPQEYFWGYKRFKRKKSLSLLILYDGRISHLKYSLAFLEIFKKSDYKIKEKIIEVKYKNFIARITAEFLSLFSNSSCLGCGRCLNLILEKDTLEKIKKDYFDIIISTGEKCAPLNLLLSRFFKAKSCLILKPNFNLSKFDLVILPEHDGIRKDNVVNIKGALTFFSDWDKKWQEGKSFFKLSQNKKISFFLGNSLKNQDIFNKNLKIFLERLKEFSVKKDYKILASTSFRTNSEAESIFEESFKDFKNKEVLVIAKRKNWDFIVPTFLKESEIIFVSGDSVSMISESLYLDKITVAVILEELPSKHEKFLKSLDEEYINILDYPYMSFSFKKPKKSLRVFNEEKLKEAFLRLV